MDIKELKKLVEEAFNQATEELMNGEMAVNLEVNKSGNYINVYFEIDGGRSGIDNGNSYVEFKKTGVVCGLGESLEGCGIEERVEELLFPRISDVMGSELKNETRTLESKHQDVGDIIETILSDFNVEYEEGDNNGYPTFTYEIPEK